MKKLFYVILLTTTVYAQAEFVDVTNQVYSFLERMETLRLISNYNSFELPKTRKEIAHYLKQVENSADKLDHADKMKLKDLETEFEYELFGTLNNSVSLIDKGDYNFLSQKEKYLYYFNKPGEAALFVNLYGEGEGIFLNDYQNKNNISTTIGIFGGQLRGTLLDKFAFYLKGTNGSVFGNREAAALRNDIKYNFKYEENLKGRFFDDTEGYLSADFDFVNFKIGRDRLQLGYGMLKALIGENAPKFDYIALNANYKLFNFSYFHGKLLGNMKFIANPVTSGTNYVEEKYIGYHRLGFNISSEFNFGIGEFIIYGNRSLDLSYLNPFNFYKSAEHANQDRDNSMLFFDANSKLIKNTKIFATLLIDDIDFGKLGTGWWGNQTLINAGIYSTILYGIIPLDIRLEYSRIAPYVFTHRLNNNNFTNFGYNLSSISEPNSELFFAQINYRFNNRLQAQTAFAYTIHGANKLNNDGSIRQNVGGNINVGHRSFDSTTVFFLDGDIEYYRYFTASLTYEPIIQYYITLNLKYLSNNIKNSGINRQLQTFFTISARF